MKNIEKLYMVGSYVCDSNGNNGINVTWYNADINTHPVNIENIIKNYECMSSEERLPSVMFVNELFTYDQLKLLEKFVEKEFGIEVFYKEFNLPIETQVEDEDGELCCYGGLGLAEGMEGSCTVQLNKLDTYNLPFKVNGFYLQDDFKSIDILDKPKTRNSFFKSLVNAIFHSDQSGEETSFKEFFDSLNACVSVR